MDTGFNAAEKAGPQTSHQQLWMILSCSAIAPVISMWEQWGTFIFPRSPHLHFVFQLVKRQPLTNPCCLPVRLPHAHMINDRRRWQTLWNLSPTLESFHLLSRFVSFCRWICSLPCCVRRRSVPRMPSTESQAEDNPYDYRHLLRKTSQRRKLIKQYWTLCPDLTPDAHCVATFHPSSCTSIWFITASAKTFKTSSGNENFNLL